MPGAPGGSVSGEREVGGDAVQFRRQGQVGLGDTIGAVCRKHDRKPPPAQRQVRVVVALLTDGGDLVDELHGGEEVGELDVALQVVGRPAPPRVEFLQRFVDSALVNHVSHGFTVASPSARVNTSRAAWAGSSRVCDVSSRAGADRLVWVDCEMTGLDLTRDSLIEIAVIVTDADLTPLDPGIDLVIHAPDDALNAMVPVVRDMHASSGLTDLVRASPVTVGAAERQVLDYVRQFVAEPGTAPLCGNSIATDRGFLSRDMPAFEQFLHYRVVDVSSVKELARRWYPRVYFNQPAKGLAHRALADISESIQELAYYRRAIFVPPPGPTNDEAAAAAAAVGGVPAERIDPTG